MADNVIDRSGGFGNAVQKDDNSEQIRELLDQVQELMIEDGADPATAEALTNYARPAEVTLSGNLADLNRMGQIANQGKIDTPPGEADIPATNLEEAFTTIVPPAPRPEPGAPDPDGPDRRRGQRGGVQRVRQPHQGGDPGRAGRARH